MLGNQDIKEFVDSISLGYFKRMGLDDIKSYLKGYNEETGLTFRNKHFNNIEKLLEIAYERRLTDIGYQIVYKLYRLIKLLEKENLEKLSCDEKSYKGNLVFNLKKDLMIETEKVTV